MHAIIWIAVAAAALLALYLLAGLLLFFKVFWRKDAPPLDEVDLSATHYADYAGQIVEGLREMRLEANTLLKIKSFDGMELAAHYYDRGGDCTAVLVHGYRAPYLNNFAISGRWLLERGCNLLILVQRAHGESGGRLISLGECEHRDLLCWLEELHARYHPKKVLVYGVSMGCNAVARASEKMPPGTVDALILDCGYVNAFETVTQQLSQMPLLPARLFTRAVNLYARWFGGFDLHTGDTRQALRNNRIPAFFIHGTADDVVPVEDGRENYLACAAPKEAWFADGAAHAVGFVAGGEALRDRLSDFLDRCGCAQDTGKKETEENTP